MEMLLESWLRRGRYWEVGKPEAVWTDDARGLTVVVGSVEQQWAARDVGGSSGDRKRLGIYDAGGRIVSITSRLPFAVNDVAFHPSEPVVVIGTGEYDGGYCFEGALLWVHLETGEIRSILDQRAMVNAVAFSDEETLEIDVAVPTDEEVEAIGTWLMRGTLRRAEWGDIQLGSVPVAELELAPVSADIDHDERDGEVERFVVAMNHGAGSFATTWDVSWLDDDHLVVARDGAAMECLSIDGAVVRWWEGPGYQVARAGDRWVAVHLPPFDGCALGGDENSDGCDGPGLTLVLTEPAGQEGAPRALDVVGGSVTTSRNGYALVRDVNRDAWWNEEKPKMDRDALVDPRGVVIRRYSLGEYDLFNHHCRIDGGRYLYACSGGEAGGQAPEVVHEGMAGPTNNVVRIDPMTGDVSELFALDWRGAEWDERRLHLLYCMGVELHDGAELIYASVEEGHVGPIQEVGEGMWSKEYVVRTWVVRRDTRTGVAKWERELSDTWVTDLCSVSSGLLAATSRDGRVLLLNEEDGRVVHEIALGEREAVNPLPIAISARGERVAVATAEGAIAVLRITNV